MAGKRLGGPSRPPQTPRRNLTPNFIVWPNANLCRGAGGDGSAHPVFLSGLAEFVLGPVENQRELMIAALR